MFTKLFWNCYLACSGVDVNRYAREKLKSIITIGPHILILDQFWDQQIQGVLQLILDQNSPRLSCLPDLNKFNYDSRVTKPFHRWLSLLRPFYRSSDTNQFCKEDVSCSRLDWFCYEPLVAIIYQKGLGPLRSCLSVNVARSAPERFG